jgi:hypothetical protein
LKWRVYPTPPGGGERESLKRKVCRLVPSPLEEISLSLSLSVALIKNLLFPQ